MLPAVVAAFAFLVYRMTLAPTVTFIDSGELAAVACTLGIAHPTGYPLFTLFGWLFAHLPIAADEIVRLNTMAAFWSAAGVGVFFSLVRFLLRTVMKRENATGTLAAAGAALLLAFSETYWSQAVAIEVYSLHAFFLAALLTVFLAAVYGEPGREWPWHLFAFLLGLSFTNHMTTVLLAPGMLYFYFATQGWGRRSLARIAAMIPLFLAGLSAYLYLPLRALQSPALNWGNPTTLERFLWHFSGKQYRVWIFSSMDAAGRQLTYFVNSVPSEFAYVGLLLAAPGVVVLWRERKKLAIMTALLFLGCVGYAINYDIHDIDSYFLLAYMTLALWAAFGLEAVYRWLVRRMRGRWLPAAACMLLLSLVPLPFHFRGVDQSGNYLVEDYTTNMFASLNQDALVFSYQWDYWVSASLYYQLVQGRRTDVAVVDKELLRRSWYLTELEQRYPWLIGESRTEVEAFRRELAKFEHDLPYNPAMIQARYVDMIEGFIRRSMLRRPVYVTAEIEQEFTAGLQRVPAGLAFLLVADSAFHPTPRPRYVFRPFDRSGRLESMVPTFYANSLVARAVYYNRGSDAREAETSLKEAALFNPSLREFRRPPGDPDRRQ
jgi:hypothetical protein